jgi:hypothetical protein
MSSPELEIINARFDPAKNSAGSYEDGIKALRAEHISKAKSGRKASKVVA